MKTITTAILVVVSITPLFGFTEHHGVIARDEVWLAAGSPHVLRGTVEVAAGAHLRIEGGVVVAASEEAQLIVAGTLQAYGTPDRRILITGFDQNQWGGLYFADNSMGELYNVTIATSSQVLMRVVSAVEVRMAGDSLQYSPFAEGAVGLHVMGGHVTISGGVVVSPLAAMYDVPLNPIVGQPPIVRNSEPANGLNILRALPVQPRDVALEQNYPNPFNPKTTIRYSLPDARHVTLSVYDVSGKEVRRLIDADQKEGMYSVDFVAGDMPSGIYFYRLQAGGFVDQKRMLLVK
jgi:hypothetical protein